MNLHSIFKNNTANPAVPHINLCHRSRSPNLNAELSCCSGKRLSNGTHPAHYMPEEALQLMFPATQQMKKQADGSAWLTWPTVLTVDVVGQKEGLDFVGFIVAIEKVAQAPRQEGDELRNFRAGNRSEASGNPEQVRPAMQAARVDLRRWLQEERLQVASQVLQLIVHAHKSLGILEGYLAKLGDSTIPLRPPRHYLSIGKRNLNRGITWHHAKPVLRQIEIADHFRTQHARN